jgi:hypothetical protein
MPIDIKFQMQSRINENLRKRESGDTEIPLRMKMSNYRASDFIILELSGH